MLLGVQGDHHQAVSMGACEAVGADGVAVGGGVGGVVEASVSDK